MKKLNKEKTMSNIFRHGEILLVPVSKLPKGKVSKHKEFIVGHSETSHHHVLESETKFDVLDKAQLYIRLFQPAKLTHKKSVDFHRTLDIPAGDYKVIPKQEYNPFEQIIQTVRD